MSVAEEPLAVTAEARAKQKAWFQGFRARVMEQGETYVIASAVSPHEIFHTMDVPVVSIPWYSAVISAKQQSPYYFSLMDEMGFHDGLPRYNTLPYFSTVDNDPERAPYGGLPKPAMILERLRSDYAQRVAELWAGEYGCPAFVLDSPALTRLRPGWFDRAQHDWEDLYETHRLDFQVEQLKALIRAAEDATGKVFSHTRFTREMHNVNRLGELIAETRDIIARTAPLPVPLSEQLTNVMACTWQRGSQWAIDHATKYRDEVKARAEAGVGICGDERVRLLWLNNGLWFNTGFYRYFEESHGAVFVWSMYSNFLSDGYRKYFTDDPLRALAARHISMNEQLHLPGWMAEWIVKQARDFGAHGAVMLTPDSDRMASMGTRFCKLALEAAGIPVLEIRASAVDARQWDDDAQRARVAAFIEERVAA
ncbi:2-hydroxyacyl-CoA dehydratase family protein [Psychromarinibacter sp. C21-152]|uniref:2-hydroxyacyl-CoA dehydratase family protein n=1 Tax=Psychromarinibacter sediminicola TaxID=3033385 RepID=A0AAE3NL58_9RHOB|nr:2-hydroxyacyl-CoA dehydratase family protein [Psychromarinibacter sediminicola]MDF0599293.1 2-hydroxyacyl-CoA dehydratase family protein [Psychromarinibacter sediminicola]